MAPTVIPVDISLLRFALLYAIIATPGIITALDLAPTPKRVGYAVAWAAFTAHRGVQVARWLSRG